MSNTTAATTPAEEVSALMKEVADEHGLEFAALPGRTKTRSRKRPSPPRRTTSPTRLAALRAG